MRVEVVTHRDHAILAKIKQTLLQQWVVGKVSVQQYAKNFDQAIKGSGEYIYALMVDSKGEIVLVAALFAEYKLTRGLCETYHLEIVYKKCSAEQELLFQRQVVKLLPGYKILGLRVSQSQIFKPNQVYMETTLYNPNLRGGL